MFTIRKFASTIQRHLHVCGRTFVEEKMAEAVLRRWALVSMHGRSTSMDTLWHLAIAKMNENIQIALQYMQYCWVQNVCYNVLNMSSSQFKVPKVQKALWKESQISGVGGMCFSGCWLKCFLDRRGGFVLWLSWTCARKTTLWSPNDWCMLPPWNDSHTDQSSGLHLLTIEYTARS